MRAIQRSDLSNRWAVLGSASGDDYLLSSELHSSSGRELRVAVDRAGNRHLVIAVDNSDRRVPDDVVGAVLVARRRLTFDTTATYLDVQCVRADLFDLFDDLLLDVIDVIDGGSGADAAIEVIDRWRSLLAVRGHQQLSQTTQRGLIAELYVLSLTADSGPLDIDTWRGPLGEPHDIVTTEFALEVKSVSAFSRNIEIHGSEQLAEPGRPLALVLVELTEDSSGLTVADAADILLSSANDRELAVSRLAMVGYSSADASTYTTRFKVEQVRYLVVTHDTPRIVPQSFPDASVPYGITHVTYCLDVQILQKNLLIGETALCQWITDKRHPHSEDEP